MPMCKSGYGRVVETELDLVGARVALELAYQLTKDQDTTLTT